MPEDVSDPRRVVPDEGLSPEERFAAVEDAVGFDEYAATTEPAVAETDRYNPAVNGYMQTHEWTDDGWEPISDTSPVRHYQEYVPTDQLIDLLVRYGPFVEVGAGNGYLTHVINQNGGDSIATDDAPPRTPDDVTSFPATWGEYYVEEIDESYTTVASDIALDAALNDPSPDDVEPTAWFEQTQWCTVRDANHTVIDQYPERDVLVAHPGGATAWTEEVLTKAAANDQRVAVVAEWYPGQDATPVFFERLHTDWDCIDRAPVYNWASTHAAGYIFVPN